ncbi:hypothetical protein AB6A40_001155 [Gnathostoma spinigerum]|uniref:Uncharacterized protein n=1 Tax=Gnathostoma spinigerum TaxID=75299 RepID=A0ABD6E5Q9_9BILA
MPVFRVHNLTAFGRGEQRQGAVHSPLAFFSKLRYNSVLQHVRKFNDADDAFVERQQGSVEMLNRKRIFGLLPSEVKRLAPGVPRFMGFDRRPPIDRST